jgi:prepilin-type N-terminal cleavage/methylation domain-containing protein
MSLQRNKQKGFSLLELLLVVAVGAILILAGLAIYRNVTNQTEINESSRLLNVIKQETQKIFAGESTYPANIVPILINADAVPGSAVNGTALVNPYGGAITVIQNAGNNAQFNIVFNAVPQSACISLGTMYTNNEPDFVNLRINAIATVAPTVAAVNTACAAANVMTWTFN